MAEGLGTAPGDTEGDGISAADGEATAAEAGDATVEGLVTGATVA
jgi:hypothetical protein